MNERITLTKHCTLYLNDKCILYEMSTSMIFFQVPSDDFIELGFLHLANQGNRV